jgi:2-polyprenyl-3-methyl-5-hydroxy-6-metoxy-1,4-benzoquinol methylase
MPKSSRNGKQAIIQWLQSVENVNKVLDVGAGKGTYKRLCDGFRVYKDIPAIGPILKNATWDAVEIWEPYIKEYELENLYDSVVNEDIREIQKELPDYDLAFVGDILEHMTKDEACRLIKTLTKKCKVVIISIPLGHHPQEAHNGNPHEEHVKDNWSHEEVIGSFMNIKKFCVDNSIGVYWIEL